MPTKKQARPSAKRKVKSGKSKRTSPADPGERLKPVSLHPLTFDEVMRRLVSSPADKN